MGNIAELHCIYEKLKVNLIKRLYALSSNDGDSVYGRASSVEESFPPPMNRPALTHSQLNLN